MNLKNLFKKNIIVDEALKKQKGQFVLEYILIGVMVLSVYTLIKRQIGDQNLIASIFSGPWTSIAKMMEDGTWNTSRSEDEIHPLATNQTRAGDTR